MKILELVKKILKGLYSSIQRFPATIIMSSATAAMLIVLSELEPTVSQSTRDILSRISMILALGIPLSLCIKHGFERYNAGLFAKIAAYLAGTAFLAVYYFLLLPNFKMVSVTRYIAVSAALYIIFAVFPYFFRREQFELYIIKLFLRLLVTALYSGVLFAGMAAILFTIDKLLLIHVYEKMYLYVWIIIAGVFAPCFFLAGIPTYGQQLETSDYSKLLRVLLLYIIMPLITAYTVILYIYFAKILITLQWPQGLVAHLVLWYSVISAAVIFLTSPLKAVNKWVKTFIFCYIKLVLPLLAIMFISIGIRINAYGVTENRYFVVALGLWVTGVMLYLNISRIKRSMVLPVSLAIIAILSVFGPWSAYSISISSQNMRFKNLLVGNDMLKNEAIIKPAKPISDNDQKEMSAILLYFNDSHSLGDVKYLPKGFELSKMKDTLGFPYEPYRYNNQNNEYISYTLKMLDEPIDISGYDSLISFQDYQQGSSVKKGSMEVKYNNSSTEIIVLNEGKEIYKHKLSDFAKKLNDKHKAENNNQLSLQDMTFEDSNSEVKLKCILNSIYGTQDPQTGEITLQGANFYILLKVK